VTEGRSAGFAVYTEAEAAGALRMKSTRALSDYRRNHLLIGEHYARLGRTILYTPRHLNAILDMDMMKKGEKK
jgi:hypothetical protein